jgi:pantoate--beta-alanine ligase
MKLIRQIKDLNKALDKNLELGFVPTMGTIHKGHESLIKSSKKKCKKTIVSIFINPTQFNNKIDYQNYPKNLNRDLKILKSLKVDYIFLPSINEVYKKKRLRKIKLHNSQKILCAKYRNGHFEGVLDIVDRLAQIISPKYIFMGEKDFQQLFLVKEFIEKKHDIKIIFCKTIRDKNKVALSSRNFLLDKDYLIKAGIIAKRLIKLKSQINKNKKKANYLIKKNKKKLTSEFNIKIEYLEVRNTINLKKSIINKKFKIFIAYYLNKVRLIDNF